MDELIVETGRILLEIDKIVLSLNEKHIKILKYNLPDEDVSINVIEISAEFIQIFDEEESHRIEFQNRTRATWTAFR